MSRHSHARPSRAGSVLILLGVLLIAAVGVVYLAEPAMAQVVLPPAGYQCQAVGRNVSSVTTPNGVSLSLVWTPPSPTPIWNYTGISWSSLTPAGSSIWIEIQLRTASASGPNVYPDPAGGSYAAPAGYAVSAFKLCALPPQTANLTVIKHVINHVGTPAVAANWTMNVTAVNPSVASFPGAESPGTTITVQPGAFSVGESGGPAGYSLVSSSAGCSGTAVAGQSYTCTITNEQDPTGTLTIVKDATPGDNTPFSFRACPEDEFDGEELGEVVFRVCLLFQLSDPSAPSLLVGGSGIWEVSEGTPPAGTLPAGWQFDDVICTGAAEWEHTGQTLDVAVGRDEQVVCTFYNSAQGRIIVNKTVPADAPAAVFGFAASFGNFWLAGGGSHDSGLIPAGAYSVAEMMPLAEGWSLASVYCNDGSSPAAIGVSPGETVTCTFNNRYEAVGGSLTIIKRTTPAGGAGFGFDGTLGAFTLDDGGMKLFEGLAAGAYTVTETPADGWEFEDVVCYTAAGAVVDYVADGASVTVNLAEGQDVTCKFANREEETVGPEGSLTILKVTSPAGGTGFAFDAGVLGTFSLDDGGSQAFTDLAAGAYVVSETPAADWEFASIECDALDYVVDGASVTVNLAEGEAAVCTFYNGELPYTGSSAWLPVLLVGLATVLAGLGVWVTGLMKGAKA